MADNNEPPKIPSFKPSKKGDSKGGPLSSFGKSAGSFSKGPSSSGIKWPSLGGGAPKLKVRGLPGGATIINRLKNLRRKDIGFISAGLSVLMMAPIAEHFMMTPQDQTGGTLTGGFDQKGPLFPDGTSIYEGGTGGFSPGSLIGAGTDVITPLNVRDPAALVMGPGATQKPAATVSPPPAMPKKEGNWKDALSQAATRGARRAVKKAKLPKPNVKMSGALRGLSALSGSTRGGGPSAKLDAPSASNVPNKARDSNSLSRSQAVPGYRGAGKRSGASSGSPESLRNAGGRQADIFNRGGAANSLDTAARSQMPGGGGYGAGGGWPGNDNRGKGPGGNNIKESKSLGESLAFLRLKQEQEKAIALKWKMKEWNDFGRWKAMEEALTKSFFEHIIGKGMMTPLGKMVESFVDRANPSGPSAKGVSCHLEGGGTKIFKQSGTQKYDCNPTSGAVTIWTKGENGWTPQPFNGCKSCAHFGGSAPSGESGGGGGGGEGQGQVPGDMPRTGGPAAIAAADWSQAVGNLRIALANIEAELNKGGTASPEAIVFKDALKAALTAHEKAMGHNTVIDRVIKTQKTKMETELTTLTGFVADIQAANKGSLDALAKLRYDLGTATDFGTAAAQPFTTSMEAEAKKVDGYTTRSKELADVKVSLSDLAIKDSARARFEEMKNELALAENQASNGIQHANTIKASVLAAAGGRAGETTSRLPGLIDTGVSTYNTAQTKGLSAKTNTDAYIGKAEDAQARSARTDAWIFDKEEASGQFTVPNGTAKGTYDIGQVMAGTKDGAAKATVIATKAAYDKIKELETAYGTLHADQATAVAAKQPTEYKGNYQAAAATKTLYADAKKLLDDAKTLNEKTTKGTGAIHASREDASAAVAIVDK